MGALAAIALCALAQNPAWPPADPDLPPEAFATPERWPGDPDYGPREDGDDCAGQLELLGFTPECTASIRDEERELGAGIAADRAWAITAGQPAVTIALADDGVDLGHPDLAARYALNPGELPFPDVGVPTVRHDINGDGAFTVLDFTSATGTVAPTVDLVLDARLRARDDLGDVDGNGYLDPKDLIEVFSNGRDDDGNGYVDDVVGWDFVEDDNDPSAPFGVDRGTQAALRAVATANNGVGGAGVCPRCTALPMRISGRGLAGGDRAAAAILYASGRRSPILHAGPAVLGASPLLTEAVNLAFARGTLIIAAAGTGSSQIANAAWPDDRVLVVGSVGHDRAARARATSQVAPDPCARFGTALHVVAPGRCDDGGAALVAGVAGLVRSAALGLDPGLAALEPGLSAGELWGLLRGAAVDLEAPGWDPRTGWGRVSARAAVDAVLRRRVPAHGRIAAPGPGAVLDPSDGRPATVTLVGSRSRHAGVRWTLAAAPGRAPAPEAFSEIESGVFEAGVDQVAQVSLPLLEWRTDPTDPIETEITVQASFQSDESEGAGTVIRRIVHVHRDLEVLPAFPIDLGAGNVGGLRAAPLIPGEPDVALVATTDGRVHAIDGRGEAQDGFPSRSPPLGWTSLRGHPRLPARADSEISPDIDAPILAPLSVANVGPEGAPLVLGITADAEVLAFGPRGAVQAGFPLALVPDLVRDPDAPAGVTAAVAARDDGAPRLWASDGREALVALDPAGGRRGEMSLGGAPGAPAIGADGTVWVATQSQLFAFADDATTPEPEWPKLLDSVAASRGLAAALLPAPVLARIEGRRFAFAAAWGGAITRFRLDGGVTALPALAWRTSLALADLDGDAQVDLLATVAPEPQFEGLAPAEAPRDARTALNPLTGGITTGFSAAGVGGLFEPLVVDVGGDAGPEVVFGDDEGRIWAIGADGRVARRFPKVAGDPLLGAPTVGDLDGDGRLELLAVTRRGRLWAWRLPTRIRAKVPWAGARGDPRSLGDAETVRRPGPADDRDGCRCLAPTDRWSGLFTLALGLVWSRRPRRAAGSRRDLAGKPS